MKMTSLIPLMLVASLPAISQAPGAAQPQSAKGVVRKNLAPVSSELLRVKLPRPVERTLKNGLKVMILENHRVPMVMLDMILLAGPVLEPPELPGVSEAVAAMLQQGTPTRTSRQIAEQVSELGAGLNARADLGSPSTRVTASALKENLDPVLALAADVLLNPTFPQDEFDKWKKRELSMLQQQRAQPGFLGAERLYQVLYPGDPRSNIGPTVESVTKMTRQDLIDFHKLYYVPSSSLLGVTGDVTPDEIVAKLEKVFGAWPSGSASIPDLAPKPPISGIKIYLVDRPSSVQTMLMLANHSINRFSPDYIPCMVLNQILGDGPASRLFINIREDKGFTYGVYSSFRAARYLDQFTATTSVRTEVTAPALDEFLKEFSKIREEAVPKEELDNAKHAIVGSFALSLESQNGVLTRMLSLKDYGLSADYWDTYAEKVMAVTAGDVQRVARKYIPLGNLQIVAVGDGNKIRDLLKKYGTVEEYNTDGKKID